VTLLSRTESEIREVKDEISRRGGKSLAIRADVSKPTEIDRAVKKTINLFHKVDILVNNAAVLGPVNRVEAIAPREWQKTIDIDLNGVFYCCRAILTGMKKKRWGKIITIASGLGATVLPRLSAYSVAKAGVIHLTRILATEVADFNIQVNAIDPGLMDTEMQQAVRMVSQEALTAELYERFHGFKNQGKLKDPKSIAPLVVFLASDRSQAITGHFGDMLHYERLTQNQPRERTRKSRSSRRSDLREP
jgi:3-oxoacyl-[acyl-carrier protein] reductase